MEILKIFAFADEADGALDGQIKAMLRNGLDGAEMRNVDGENISDISIEKAREIKERMDDAGLAIWTIGSPIGKIDIDKDDFSTHLDKFRHTLDIAEVLGAENIRLFSFYIPKDREPSDYKNEVIDRLGRFCTIAAERKIDLCHENEKGIYGDVCERCLELHKALPDIKGIFDPANFIQCGVDTAKAWKTLAPFVKYLHIKDALESGDVVPAGMGIGNIHSIVKDYIANGGKAFTIEPHLAVFSGLESLEKECDSSKIGLYKYPDNNTAFDAACKAFKNIL